VKSTKYIVQNWKVLLNILTVGILVIIVILLRHNILSTLSNLGKANAFVLLLLIPIEALNYHCQAKLYQGLFSVVGNKVDYKSLYKVSLELNFVNNVFPTAGVSGVSYFGLRTRSNEITGGKASIVQLIKLTLIFASFELLMIIGLIFMALSGRVNDVTILVATLISTLTVVLTSIFIYIVRSRTRINAAFLFFTKLINKIIHAIRPANPETIKLDRVRTSVDELHDNYKLISSDYRKLKWPFAYAFLANFTEVLAIYAVYVAFGRWVNLGAVIIAYAVANFAGLIAVLPGGLGVYEAIMTAVTAAAGIPVRLSLPVVVCYRILNTIIQMPPGYYFYHRALNRIPAKTSSQ
jgi:uncharacterized protein (TIRG00374 family)